MKLYYIEWTDSSYNSGWKFNDDKSCDVSPSIVKSVGWMIYDKKDYIVLAQSIDEETNAERLSIPKSLISKKRIIRIA